MPLFHPWDHLASYCCGLQGLRLGRAIECFPSLEVCIDSDSMRAGSQGEVFQIISSSGPLNFASQTRGVFSNRVLL